MRKKYYSADNREVVYFASANENTIPSQDIVLEEIEKCIPMEYSIMDHIAYHTKPLWGGYVIRYVIDRMDVNRYRVAIWYDEEMGLLQYLASLAVFIIGGMFCYDNFGGGAFVGAFGSILLFRVLLGRGKKAVANVCDAMVNGLKEYERAHLLSLGNNGSDNQPD